jgi:hypothetical protein
MIQLNKKTQEEKRMQPFTTNWYLYKTYTYPISAKTQKTNTKTNSHEPQKRLNQKKQHQKNSQI